MRDLQPPSVKLVDPNVPDVQWVSDTFVAAPHAWLVLRSHAMSEQKGDVMRDVAGTGARHAGEWRMHVDTLRAEAQRRGLPFPPDSQLLVLGINEPVLDAPGALPVDQRMAEMRKRAAELDLYTEAFLDTCARLGLVAGALNLSVGWPTNWDLPGHPLPGAAPDWSLFPRSYAAIKRGKHFLFLHEYWDNRGPAVGWGWWAGRYQQCPWDVPIIIGECGLDMYVSKGDSVAKENRGWRGWLKPEGYLAQLCEYHERVLLDPRIHSIQPYTSDFSHPWSSFDLLPLYSGLVAYAQEAAQRPAPQQPWTGYVTATNGLNLRAGAGTSTAIIRTLPLGTAVTVQARVGAWYLVTHAGTPGYMAAEFISDHAPTTVFLPVVATPGDDDLLQHLATDFDIDVALVRAVLAVESGGDGFQDGRLKLRFEPHILRERLLALFDGPFTVGEPAWNGNMHRHNGVLFHGSQDGEYAALTDAIALTTAACYEAASYGAGQLMGVNHAVAGYDSAQAMMTAFARDAATHLRAVLMFCKNSHDANGRSALDCLRAGDFLGFAQIYNGAGQPAVYADRIRQALVT